jgi:hypothetical protein
MEARGTANGKATEVGAKEKARAKVQETAGEARETLETSTRVAEGKARSEFQRSARGRGAVVHQRGVTCARRGAQHSLGIKWKRENFHIHG